MITTNYYYSNSRIKAFSIPWKLYPSSLLFLDNKPMMNIRDAFLLLQQLGLISIQLYCCGR